MDRRADGQPVRHLIRTNRQGFNGPLNLSFEGLPEGITVHVDPVAAEVDRVIAVAEAAPDAKVAGSLIDVVAKNAEQKIEGGFRQDVNLVYGPPNNTIYYGARVHKLAVAVAEEAPFTLKIVEPKVPIVQNGSMNLKVVAERKKDFTAAIELRFLWSPPGIGAQGTVSIPQGQNEVDYPINANGNAATKSWKIAVIGSAPGANGVVWISSQLAPLTVAPPFVAMKIEMTTVEQGRNADVPASWSSCGRSRAGEGRPYASPRRRRRARREGDHQGRQGGHLPREDRPNSPAGSTSRSSPRSWCRRRRHDGPQRGRRRRDAHRHAPPRRRTGEATETAKPGEPAKRLSRLEQPARKPKRKPRKNK